MMQGGWYPKGWRLTAALLVAAWQKSPTLALRIALELGAAAWPWRRARR